MKIFSFCCCLHGETPEKFWECFSAVGMIPPSEMSKWKIRGMILGILLKIEDSTLQDESGKSLGNEWGADGPEGKLEKLVRNRIVFGGGIEFLLRTLFVVLIHNSILWWDINFIQSWKMRKELYCYAYTRTNWYKRNSVEFLTPYHPRPSSDFNMTFTPSQLTSDSRFGFKTSSKPGKNDVSTERNKVLDDMRKRNNAIFSLSYVRCVFLFSV